MGCWRWSWRYESAALIYIFLFKLYLLFLGNGGATSNAHGLAYGSADKPILPGSSGSASCIYPTAAPGTGGGVIYINITGDAQINGTISANGAQATSGIGGGGSGGSIQIYTGGFSGTGAISSDGGNGVNYVPCCSSSSNGGGGTSF